MLRVALVLRGLIDRGGDGGDKLDEFKGKDFIFMADWLKTKGLHKLSSIFEGV